MPAIQRYLEGFAAPEDIAVRHDGGRIAIADTNQHRILWADLPNAAPLQNVGVYGAGAGQGIAFPEAAAFDSNENLLVLDLWNRRIVRYTPTAGNYVFDVGFGPANGINANGTALGYARDLAVDAADVLFVVDTTNKRIVEVNGGAAPATIALPSTTGNAYGLSLLPGGGFVVVDRDRHKVLMLDAAGAVTGEFGGYGTAEGRLRFPAHAAVAPNGNVWVADTDNRRVQEFAADGTFIRVVLESPQFRQLRRLRFAPNGTLYAVDAGRGVVHEISDAVPTRALHVSRTSLPFGDVRAGYTLEIPVALSNVGQQTLDVQALTVDDANFGLDLDGAAMPLTLAPGAHRTLYVAFSPPAEGASNGALNVQSDAIQDVTSLPLNGNGIAAATVSVALVLDRSGSMSAPHGPTTRIEELRAAVDVFAALMRKDACDALSIVSFNQASRVDLPLTPVTSANASTLASSVLATINAAGSTSIGTGIQAGLAQVASATTGHKVLIVLSDGIENAAPIIADVPLPTDVKVYAVGLGDPDDIDVGKLASITNVSGGSLLVTGQDAFLLPKFFVQAAADLFDQFIATDPPMQLGRALPPQNLPVLVVQSDHAARAVVIWGPVSASPRLTLQAPDGTRVVPAMTLLPRAAVLEVALPAGAGRQSFHEGEWTLVLEANPRWKPTEVIDVNASVIVDSDLRFDVAPSLALSQRLGVDALADHASCGQPLPFFFVGDRVGFDVRISDRGRAIQHLAANSSTSADVPARTVGQSLAKAGAHAPAIRDLLNATPTSTDPASAGSRLKAFTSKVKEPVTATHNLRYVPSILPGSTALVVSTATATTPGVQSFVLKVRVDDVHGKPATREKTVAAYVWPEIALQQTAIKLAPALRGYLLEVRPRDRFGTLLGPGWVDSLRIGGDAIHVGSVQDLGDGGYQAFLTLTHELHRGGRHLTIGLGPSGIELPLPADSKLTGGWSKPARKPIPGPDEDVIAKQIAERQRQVRGRRPPPGP